MLKFSNFMLEAAAGAEIDAKGKLHELLVGHYLQGGKHMEKHADKNGDSPEEAFNKIKQRVSPEDFSQINARAKAAAEDIKSHFASRGKPISKVSWTSQPGDIERATGIKASQHDDPSDIILHHSDGTHTGISLKVSDKKNKKVPIANIGAGTMDKQVGASGLGHQAAAREEIVQKHPEIAKLSNKASRKEYIKANPDVKASVDSIHKGHMQAAAADYHKALSNMSTSDLAQHIRQNVLHARATAIPHFKHTAGGLNGNYSHSLVHPYTHYDNILNDHKNLSVEHAGNGVVIRHNGKKFVRLQVKRDSNSDSHAGYKVIGSE